MREWHEKDLVILMSEHQLEGSMNHEIFGNSPHDVPNEVPDSGSNHGSDSRSDPPLSRDEPRSLPQFLANRRVGFVLVGVLLLATLGFFGFRAVTAAKPDKSGKTGDKREQVTPVTVATVMQKTVPIQLQAIGTVQAATTVAVTPQAGGRITGVYFKKGQEVHKGDLLFTLDDRSQTASIQQAQGVLDRDRAQVQQARATLAKDLGLVRQAEATLAKDEAQAQFSQAQSDRYTNLYKQGAISQDQAQQYATNSQVSAATLQADREAIANAQAVVEGDKAAIANAEAVLKTDEGAYQNVEVQSSYTKIYAPIDGRAGNILVTEGNVVQANSSNPLVTIAQIHPIQVSFSIPEANLSQIQRRMSNGKLRVDVTFAGSSRSTSGVLTFINNTVDSATGTIQLIGDFDNADGTLFPGQFVNTTLTLNQEPNATVVPAQAVQNGPNGQFVFVVNSADNTVENVPVVASSSIDGLDVVQKGLKPGDQVVTDGQANLVSGSKVRLKSASDAVGNTDAKSTTDQSAKSGKPRKHRSQTSGDQQPAKPAGGN
jgi:multidrug efflux system membrane fusion protein